MLNHEALVTGITVYGLGTLFVKAWLIVLLGQSLYEQCEFSPASIRHSIWTAALLGLFTLPVLTLLLPTWTLSFFSIELAPEGWFTPSESGASTMAIAIINGAIVVYLLVALWLLVRLIASVIEITLVTIKSQIVDEGWEPLIREVAPGRRYKVKVSDQVKSPITWGIVCPVIIVPERSRYWSEQERKMVLQHECSHIRRGDWLVQFLGQLVCILYWPVPGVKSAFSRLSLEAEQACDDKVLGEGANAADYAHLLLRQARIKKLQAAIGLGQPSEFGCRVRHIVSATVDRTGEKRMKALLYVFCAVFMLPYASFQATASLQKPSVYTTPINLTDLPTDSITTVARMAREFEPIDRPQRPTYVSAPRVPSLTKEDTAPLPDISKLVDIGPVAINGTTVDVEYIEVIPAKKLIGDPPHYPGIAARRGIEGRVVVEFDVDDDGGVHNPQVVFSQPEQVFDRSVLKAISAYHFEPHRINGEATPVSGLREEFRFQLITGQ